MSSLGLAVPGLQGSLVTRDGKGSLRVDGIVKSGMPLLCNV